MTETQIGIVFFVNTVVIVLAQLPIARSRPGPGGGCPRLALLGLLWAAAWVVVPIAGLGDPRERLRPLLTGQR